MIKESEGVELKARALFGRSRWTHDGELIGRRLAPLTVTSLIGRIKKKKEFVWCCDLNKYHDVNRFTVLITFGDNTSVVCVCVTTFVPAWAHQIRKYERGYMHQLQSDVYIFWHSLSLLSNKSTLHWNCLKSLHSRSKYGASLSIFTDDWILPSWFWSIQFEMCRWTA